MSSRGLYLRFASLCQKWPKDPTKSGRDYGEYFRQKFSELFPHGELSQLKDTQSVEKALSSLERIANNHYFNENPLKISSSTGLDVGICRESVSNKGLRLVQEQDESSLIYKLKKALDIKLLKDSESNVKERHSNTQKHLEEK